MRGGVEMVARRVQRRAAAKISRPRILVLCEGRCTENQYLEAVRRRLRVPEQNLEILHPPEIPNTPREMVRDAKSRKRGGSDSFDEVWCVFDVEAKLTQQAGYGLHEALDAAQRSGIQPALSNPCFEIWLLWHNTDQAAWIASDAVQRRCEELGLTYGKDGKHIRDAESLIQNCYEAARNRARTLDQAHDRNGTTRPEDRNPSSGMHRLIDVIFAAFPPRI